MTTTTHHHTATVDVVAIYRCDDHVILFRDTDAGRDALGAMMSVPDPVAHHVLMTMATRPQEPGDNYTPLGELADGIIVLPIGDTDVPGDALPTDALMVLYDADEDVLGGIPVRIVLPPKAACEAGTVGCSIRHRDEPTGFGRSDGSCETW